MSTTCSVLPRDLVSVEIAAEQFGAHPQTLLTSSKFPVHYPVLAPERGPRWQSHAQRRKLNISVRVDQVHLSDALTGACTGKGPQMAIPRPTPKTEHFGPRWPGPRFRCIIRCLHRKGAPDGKPTPNAENWESRSALAARHQRQPCRLFLRRPLRGLKIIVGSFGIPWG